MLGEQGWRGGVQREQDSGCSVDAIEDSVEELCRTDFCALKYAFDSLNLTISMESVFLFDVLSGVPRGRGVALEIGGGARKWVLEQRCWGNRVARAGGFSENKTPDIFLLVRSGTLGNSNAAQTFAR